MATLRIGTVDELRQADHKAVIAWERYMRESEGAAASTIRRRLAALSVAVPSTSSTMASPCVIRLREIARHGDRRQEGTTLAFSKVQARKLLDLPAEDTIAGLRDRAILSVGLQVGLRRAEIAALKVGDLHQNRGFDSLRVTRKDDRHRSRWRSTRKRQRTHPRLSRRGRSCRRHGRADV